jgi:hypothetical protein
MQHFKTFLYSILTLHFITLLSEKMCCFCSQMSNSGICRNFLGKLAVIQMAKSILLLWSTNVHCRFHKTRRLIARHQFNAVKTLALYFCKVSFLLALSLSIKVKQSLYTPWRRLGGEEV